MMNGRGGEMVFFFLSSDDDGNKKRILIIKEKVMTKRCESQRDILFVIPEIGVMRISIL